MDKQITTLAEQLAEENKTIEFATGKKDNPDDLQGKVTAAQIEKFKTAHPGGFYAVKTGGHIAYFRYPTRSEASDAILNQVEGDPFSAYAQMAEMSFIGGSVDILTTDRLYLSSIHKIKMQIDGDAEVINF